MDQKYYLIVVKIWLRKKTIQNFWIILLGTIFGKHCGSLMEKVDNQYVEMRGI